MTRAGPSVSPALRDAAPLALLLLALPLLRAGLLEAGGFELHFDEAQYWEWSRRLDWSYYSKGPLVAWLIAGSTALFGQGEWQVRLPAWIAFDAWLLVLFLFARDVWGSRRAGWWAVALGLAVPLYFLLGGVMTTDVLLLPLWTAGLWAALRIVRGTGGAAWYAFGAAVGLGALTKLSIGLVPLLVLPQVLLDPRARRDLATPHPWLAGLLALALASPMLGWNAANDWVMLRHEQGHVAGRGPESGHLPEFLAGQVLALSPVIAVLVAIGVARLPADRPRRLLWLTSLGVIAFFLVKASTSKVQLNWPAPAYVGLLVLFAGDPLGPDGRRRRALALGLAIGGASSLLALFPALVGLPGDRDPFRPMKAWREPVRTLAARAEPVDFVLTRRYTLAGGMAFYWPRPIAVYLTGDAERRMNQYDLWPGVNREAGRTGLVVDTRPELPAGVAGAFAACQALEPVPARAADGRVIRTLHGWRCEGLRPVEWPRPGSY